MFSKSTLFRIEHRDHDEMMKKLSKHLCDIIFHYVSAMLFRKTVWKYYVILAREKNNQRLNKYPRQIDKKKIYFRTRSYLLIIKRRINLFEKKAII